MPAEYIMRRKVLPVLLMDEKTIKTRRLMLRNWAETDRDDFIKLSEDPHISEWTGRSVPASELFSYYLQTGTAFAVLYEGKTIGNFSLFRNSLTRGIRAVNVMECAFYTLPQFHGQGLGSEALKALLEYARNEQRADAVICGSYSSNERSLRFIKRNGGAYCFSRELPSGKTEEFFVFA